jgi:hypothetical protein
MPARDTVKRELRVALSRRAQPAWFRISKWVIAIALIAAFRRSPYLWWWILGALGLSVLLHLFWRWKTKGWTQPWGGWSDTETADPPQR